MTDKDIIKALKLCTEIKTSEACDDCPYRGLCREDGDILEKDALALINRQQAEIERLKTKCENTQIGYNFAEDEIKNLKKDKYKLQKALNQSEDYRVIAKAEAVKEFAERLKKEIDIRPTYSREQNKYVVFLIDNLVKEMVGDNNE